MGKVNKLQNLIALTSTMEVAYLTGAALKPSSSRAGRCAFMAASITGRRKIRNREGEALASSTSSFIEVDAHRMFAKYLKKKHSDAT